MFNIVTSFNLIKCVSFCFINLNLPKSLKSFHMHSIPMHLITGTITGFSSSSLFISVIMSSETPTDQEIKALQAQNAQFQEMFLNLAKGRKDLKTLILKDKKKKKKKTVLLNMGHGFGNRLREEVYLSYSSGGGENQEERKGPSPVVSDNDTDFDED